MVVILAVAGGTYFWFTHLVSGANSRVDPDVSAALTSVPPTSLDVAVPASPGAMNILLLGSDKRGNVRAGRADTIMLVHIDPKQDFVSTLALPRDLRVEIPGHGTNKLNAAYAIGGPALVIRTVKQATGVNIDHFLQVDFAAFQELTDSVGGVYIDVDRKYFNSGGTYEPIDIQAGYQLLNGRDALDYVRFRHDSNSDFGRMARQQAFLSSLKNQISGQGAQLLLKLPGLAGDLFSNATTDLSADQILRTAYFGARLDGGRIRQVRLIGEIRTVKGVSYVLVPEADLTKAVKDYLTPPTQEGTANGGATTTEVSGPATGTTGNHDLKAWQSVAATVPFAVEAPDYLPDGYTYSDRSPASRQDLHDQGRWGRQARASDHLQALQTRPVPGSDGDKLARRAHSLTGHQGRERRHHLQRGRGRGKSRRRLVEEGRRALLGLEHPFPSFAAERVTPGGPVFQPGDQVAAAFGGSGEVASGSSPSSV